MAFTSSIVFSLEQFQHTGVLVSMCHNAVSLEQKIHFS